MHAIVRYAIVTGITGLLGLGNARAQTPTFTIQGNAKTTLNHSVGGALTVTSSGTFGQGVYSPSLSISGSGSVGSLTVTGFNATATLKIPTQSTNPGSSCSPGQLLLGPGGSDSNGKGGYLFFCRLGGTWATADFGNYSLADGPPKLEYEGEIARLGEEIKALKALLCADHPKAKVCGGSGS